MAYSKRTVGSSYCVSVYDVGPSDIGDLNPDDVVVEEITIDYTPSCPQVPSKETAAHYIQTESPSRKALDVKDVSKRGKWMIFLNRQQHDSRGLTRLDQGWYAVADLVAKNVLPRAKCSTALGSVTATSSEDGVIICYTSDYTDKADVKRIAKAVQRATKYWRTMYYKTNEASQACLYRRFGDKQVSMYRFTPDDKLYERNEQGQWQLADVDDKVSGYDVDPSDLEHLNPDDVFFE